MSVPNYYALPRRQPPPSREPLHAERTRASDFAEYASGERSFAPGVRSAVPPRQHHYNTRSHSTTSHGYGSNASYGSSYSGRYGSSGSGYGSYSSYDFPNYGSASKPTAESYFRPSASFDYPRSSSRKSSKSSRTYAEPNANTKSSRKQHASSKKQHASSKKQHASSQKQHASSKKQRSSKKQQTSSKKQQTSSKKQQSSSGSRTSASSKQSKSSKSSIASGMPKTEANWDSWKRSQCGTNHCECCKGYLIAVAREFGIDISGITSLTKIYRTLLTQLHVDKHQHANDAVRAAWTRLTSNLNNCNAVSHCPSL